MIDQRVMGDGRAAVHSVCDKSDFLSWLDSRSFGRWAATTAAAAIWRAYLTRFIDRSIEQLLGLVLVHFLLLFHLPSRSLYLVLAVLVLPRLVSAFTLFFWLLSIGDGRPGGGGGGGV